MTHTTWTIVKGAIALMLATPVVYAVASLVGSR